MNQYNLMGILASIKRQIGVEIRRRDFVQDRLISFIHSYSRIKFAILEDDVEAATLKRRRLPLNVNSTLRDVAVYTTLIRPLDLSRVITKVVIVIPYRKQCSTTHCGRGCPSKS